MRNGMKSRTPGEAPGQRIRGAAFPWWVLGTVLVLAFGLWHLRDVRAGVIETGDAFLCGWYGLHGTRASLKRQAMARFGDCGGIAQQYLFAYAVRRKARA